MTQLLEDLWNMMPMFGQVPGLHQDVINVDQHEAVNSQNLIHESLEYGGGID